MNNEELSLMPLVMVTFEDKILDYLDHWSDSHDNSSVEGYSYFIQSHVGPDCDWPMTRHRCGGGLHPGADLYSSLRAGTVWSLLPPGNKVPGRVARWLALAEADVGWHMSWLAKKDVARAGARASWRIRSSLVKLLAIAMLPARQ